MADRIEKDIKNIWIDEQDKLRKIASKVPLETIKIEDIKLIAGTYISFVKNSDISISCIAVTNNWITRF